MEILLTSRTARYANAKERQIAGPVLKSSSKSAHTIIPLAASLPSVQTSAEILRGLARRNTQPYSYMGWFIPLCVERARCFTGNIISWLLLGDQNAYCCHSCFFSDTTLCQSVSFYLKKAQKMLVFAGSLYLFICRACTGHNLYCSVEGRNDFALSAGESHSKQYHFTELQNVSNTRSLHRSARPPQTFSCIELLVVCGFMGAVEHPP
jgi:hypothetical protein